MSARDNTEATRVHMESRRCRHAEALSYTFARISSCGFRFICCLNVFITFEHSQGLSCKLKMCAKRSVDFIRLCSLSFSMHARMTRERIETVYRNVLFG